MNCLHCSKEFTPIRNGIYCSRLCSARAWKLKNKEKHSADKARWKKINKDRVNYSNSSWRRGSGKNYCNLKRKNDVNYRIAQNLRARTRNFLKGKNASAVTDLGCSLDELRTYLEHQFQPGMSWENYGPKGWHIDHIKPLSKYTLSNREVYLKLIHYTNLSPKWWYDNIVKSNKEI